MLRSIVVLSFRFVAFWIILSFLDPHAKDTLEYIAITVFSFGIALLWTVANELEITG